MSRFLTIALIAMALFGTSCSDDSCSDNGSSLPLATFYVGNQQQYINTLSIMGIGVPGDSLLVDSTSTSYALWRPATVGTATIRDTLTLDYEPIEYFHSIECGTMYNFNIQRVTHTTHGIDSVVVLTPLVTNLRTPALRIHFTAL